MEDSAIIQLLIKIIPLNVKSVDGASNLDDIVEVATGAGSYNTCALNSSGKVLCWGYGGNGQLGNDKSDNDNKLPVYVVDGDGSSTHLEGIVQISTGNNHSCALKTDGGVLCWGYGNDMVNLVITLAELVIKKIILLNALSVDGNG